MELESTTLANLRGGWEEIFWKSQSAVEFLDATPTWSKRPFSAHQLSVTISIPYPQGHEAWSEPL
jgi:hypothetical protein